ncbi:hypothetical protein FIBSPDRAFT_901576 [Athelia psychrophila]|uniref:Uncharacterized protein n=1 Tax=Athelia psychrophila TaxID=1759441 RepID=A0A165WZL5_9AGAM|nr:hypothetical protein FIBSPDRAFT_901576 [Fibularhizoctonia sp. CBS 109695]
MSITTTTQTRIRPLSAAPSPRILLASRSPSPSPRPHSGLAPLLAPYELEVQADRLTSAGAIRVEHRRTGQVHTFTVLSPSQHTRTRLLPIDATSAADLTEAANHLVKAEWSELAVEGELLSQSPDDGYGAIAVDRLMPELLRHRLNRARMEVSFYAEIQARREQHAQRIRPGMGPIPTYNEGNIARRAQC